MARRAWGLSGIFWLWLAGAAGAQISPESGPATEADLEISRKGTLAIEVAEGLRPLQVGFSTEAYTGMKERQPEGREVRLVPGYRLELLRQGADKRQLSHYFTLELPLSYFSTDPLDWNEGVYSGDMDLRRLAMGLQVGFGVNVGEPLVLLCRAGEDFFLGNLDFEQGGGDPFRVTRTFAGTRFRVAGGVSLATGLGEVSLLYEYQGGSPDTNYYDTYYGAQMNRATQSLRGLDDQTLTLRISALF